MAEAYAGISVPPGSPGALRGAARQFVAVSDGLRESADDLRGMPTTLGSWQGPASANYAASCLTVSEAATRTAQGWRTRATAVEMYADELEEARRDAQEAITDAKVAKRRINEAKVELAQARRRLGDAVNRIGQAQRQILASAGAATPDLGAEEALRQAEDDRDKAEQDIRHWRTEYEDAEDDLERAVRRGDRAEQRAKTAAATARGAIRGVDQAAPYWMPPSVPALKPVSGFAPDPPDVDEGFCDGGLGGLICDGGDFVGDVGYGLGKAGEEGFTAVTHPGDTAEGLWYSTTHPLATLDALSKSCDGMSPGDCIGYLGGAAIGAKGVTKAVSTANRRRPGGDSSGSDSGDTEDDSSESGSSDADRADARAGTIEKFGEAAGMAGLPMGGELGKIGGLLSRPEQRVAWQLEARRLELVARRLELNSKKGVATLLTTGELYRGVRKGLSDEQIEALGKVAGGAP